MIISPMSMDVTLNSYQVGPGHMLTLTAMMQLFQESAYRHAEELNWGYDVLEERGLVWILSRTKVLIHKLPLWDEYVSVITAPYRPKGLMAPRDYILKDGLGNTLVEATSHWLLVDREKMKPLPPTRLFGQIVFEKGEGLCQLKMDKLPKEEEGEILQQRLVGMSLLDQNNHVNNARYMDLVVDSLDIESIGSVRTLELSYQQEALVGDRLDIIGAKDDEGRILRYIHRGDERIFASRITLGDGV